MYPINTVLAMRKLSMPKSSTIKILSVDQNSKFGNRGDITFALSHLVQSGPISPTNELTDHGSCGKGKFCKNL